MKTKAEIGVILKELTIKLDHWLHTEDKTGNFDLGPYIDRLTEPQVNNLRELRFKAITGTFIIGDEGIKEPPNWEFYAKRLEEMILAGMFYSHTPINEARMEQDFIDWLGWEGKAPDKDDPDYYTYTWGMSVWVNCAKQKK